MQILTALLPEINENTQYRVIHPPYLYIYVNTTLKDPVVA